jgi:NRPS condensation-like uncharacterized protein
MKDNRIWQVWTEDNVSTNLGVINGDVTLFEGTKTEAHKYYKEHGGQKAGLHIGYIA